MIPRFINSLLPTSETKRATVFAVASFLAGALCSPFFGFVITGTLGSFQERATFPMLAQKIEFVRASSALIPCDSRVLAFAPIIAEVVGWNLRIAHEQEANRHWYSDYFSPDGWNSLKPIPIPCEVE